MALQVKWLLLVDENGRMFLDHVRAHSRRAVAMEMAIGEGAGVGGRRGGQRSRFDRGLLRLHRVGREMHRAHNEQGDSTVVHVMFGHVVFFKFKGADDEIADSAGIAIRGFLDTACLFVTLTIMLFHKTFFVEDGSTTSGHVLLRGDRYGSVQFH